GALGGRVVQARPAGAPRRRPAAQGVLRPRARPAPAAGARRLSQRPPRRAPAHQPGPRPPPASSAHAGPGSPAPHGPLRSSGRRAGPGRLEGGRGRAVVMARPPCPCWRTPAVLAVAAGALLPIAAEVAYLHGRRAEREAEAADRLVAARVEAAETHLAHGEWD